MKNNTEPAKTKTKDPFWNKIKKGNTITKASN
jgi:hypothetical protein